MIDDTKKELARIVTNAPEANVDIKSTASYLFDDKDLADFVLRFAKLKKTNTLRSNDKGKGDKEPGKGDLNSGDVVSHWLGSIYNYCEADSMISLDGVLHCSSLSQERGPRKP